MEFFLVYRFLEFELAKTFLREEIISSLNGVLNRIGVVTSSTIQVELTGIVQSSEIMEIIHKLTTGKIGFKEAIDKVKSP